MIPDWLTVFPCLPALSFCRAAIQLQLAGDHSLSEVSFADRFGIEQEKRIAQTRFLFPEGASDLCKNFPTPDFRGMRQRRRARIRIHGRAVGDNEKRNFIFQSHPAKTTSNAQRSTSNVQSQADVVVRNSRRFDRWQAWSKHVLRISSLAGRTRTGL